MKNKCFGNIIHIDPLKGELIMLEGLELGVVLEIIAVIISVIGSIFILRFNFRRYGLVYLITCVGGAILCSLFVYMGFYSFPVKIIPISPIPLVEMFTTIPFYVLLGIRYSPVKWIWKIPFYWGLVHIAMFLEVLVLFEPINIIEYKPEWDVWDSYTWWWIYLLLAEWIGGKIVPDQSRKPINSELFRYGRWGWIIFHFIVITTIFLAGFYAGWQMKH